MKSVKCPAIKVSQLEQDFIVTKLKARDLINICYVSVRGRDNEPGAVQRFLNSRRIASIKEFTLHQASYPSSIVLNWVNQDELPLVKGANISIPLIPRSAQLIDGQHRVAGIEAAMLEEDHIGDIELPVTIYTGLTTKQCANIFLSINTEQKPVPRSLVYDLYMVADEEIVDPTIARARDIAEALNVEEDSPYFEEIKTPGSPRRRGGIALSSAVGAIKPLVEEKGPFEQIGIESFEQQKDIIKNYFIVISKAYGEVWQEKTNAFMYASGFTGAMEFLAKRVVPYCASSDYNFTKEHMQSALKLSKDALILQEEVKGLQGKEAPNVVFKSLLDNFFPVAKGGKVKI
ncbi:DNA sulfur modification protein DndB [Pseudomonas parafulva]|uniref:DNA sulfur modification protein DndB n=1 Tax=Pseudomonas parafulva TaxID=157782 RepID=UPI00048F8ADB|nr:DNA sulfur modification protein DndB [Pseudomonas parafulva]